MEKIVTNDKGVFLIQNIRKSFFVLANFYTYYPERKVAKTKFKMQEHNYDRKFEILNNFLLYDHNIAKSKTGLFLPQILFSEMVFFNIL